MRNICLSFLSAIGSFVVGFMAYSVGSKVYDWVVRKISAYFENKGYRPYDAEERATEFILKVLIVIVLTIVFDIIVFK